MALNNQFDQETLQRVLKDAFFSHVKSQIRDRILESVKDDIDKAVDGAVELFEADLQSYFDMARGGHLVKLIVERRPESAK